MSYKIVLSATSVADRLDISYFKNNVPISNSTSSLLSVAPLSINNTNNENLVVEVQSDINLMSNGLSITNLTLLPSEEIEISHSTNNYFNLEYINGGNVAGDTVLISSDKYVNIHNDFTLKNSKNIIYFTSDNSDIDIIEDEQDTPVSNRFYELKNNDIKTIDVHFGFDVEINKNEIISDISLQSGASIRLFKKADNLYSQSYKADDDSYIDKAAFSSDLVVEKISTNNALYVPAKNRYYRATKDIDRIGLDLKNLEVSHSFYIKCDKASQVVFFNGLEAVSLKHDYQVNSGDKLLVIITEVVDGIRIFDIVRTASALITSADDELRNKYNEFINSFNNLLLQRVEDKKEIDELKSMISELTSSDS